MRLLQDLGPRQVAFGATLARCRSIASGGQFKQGVGHDGDDPDAAAAPRRARRRRGRGTPAQHCSIHSARHRRPGSRAHARPAAHRAGARTGPARHPAPAHLLGRGRHELARVPVQPAPDHAARLRLCGLYDLRGGPRRPRAARHAARGRLCARGHCGAPRRGCPTGHRTPPGASAPDRGCARRRGSGQ